LGADGLFGSTAAHPFYGYGTRGFKEMAAFEAVLEAGMSYVAYRAAESAPSHEPPPIRSILLAHGDTIIRAGLKCLLDSQTSLLEVVAEAADFQEAARWVSEQKPDFVIVDSHLPPSGGIDATRRLVARFGASVLLFGGMPEAHLDSAALCAGARCFVSKCAPVQELLGALHSLAAEKNFLNQEFGNRLAVRKASRRLPLAPNRVVTEREREVLQLLSEGHSTKEIAQRLNISGRTVETHRGQITAKLNIHSTAELTKYAIRHGITGL
jgi:DNA-binding NarL/FixJ family response regulator